MPLWIKETHRIKPKEWRRGHQQALDAGMKTLSISKLRHRRDKLSYSKFKSEMWFRQKIVNRFSNYSVMVARNHPVMNCFFADFLFIRKKLIIEVDGSSHDNKSSYDRWRDKKITAIGFKIFRVKAFDDASAETALDAVAAIYKFHLQQPRPKVRIDP